MEDATGPYQQAEVAAALADGPFRGAFANGAPIVVVAGAPARVRWASDAALVLFECGTLNALNALLVEAESPGARRLRRLAATNAGQKTPRLEQLRFYGRGSPMALGLFTAHDKGSDGQPWLVLAATMQADAEVAPPSPRMEEAPIAAPSAEPARTEFAAPPLDGPVRFLWSLDVEGRFLAVDPALGARLGANAPKSGESLSELSTRTGLGPAWSEKIDARRTFSSLRLEWP